MHLNGEIKFGNHPIDRKTKATVPRASLLGKKQTTPPQREPPMQSRRSNKVQPVVFDSNINFQS